MKITVIAYINAKTKMLQSRIKLIISVQNKHNVIKLQIKIQIKIVINID